MHIAGDVFVCRRSEEVKPRSVALTESVCGRRHSARRPGTEVPDDLVLSDLAGGAARRYIRIHSGASQAVAGVRHV
ncbi:hypothetical protein BWP39_22200 [Paraburkholderia acidicola]|uniref:Uncharacterized protein n=1 Tax=Paraburkholderia acidicola TaxID=1912599 RepID=A0A2A4ELL0_9BURK|nr:hypothetical protein BWP39_22200 [Paraburkholderia acidicola]